MSENLTPRKLSEIKLESKQRLLTGFSEMDNVLGGGIVKGSVVLLAGDPGIGKSTLLLQIASHIKNPTLYLTGEESEEQIKIRATRILKETKNSQLLLLSLTNTDAALEVFAKIKPALIVVDSIQTMESFNVSGMSGSIGQVRYAASTFIKFAKTFSVPIILIGHVTKEGMVAGPMILSHMVDTVLFLEGEKYAKTRILKSLKNRFGPVDEVGVFSMEENGISEIKNPEQLFLTLPASEQARITTSGSVLVATMEGTRAFLVEVQALVVSSHLPMSRRVAAGIDYKRLELLLAVLQKHCNLPLGTMDVFFNVAGGLKLSDPAADLGICLAIFSSFKNLSLSKTVAISEVGLLGELRAVEFLDKRIKQAKKLGFKNIITSVRHKTINDVIKSFNSS